MARKSNTVTPKKTRVRVSSEPLTPEEHAKAQAVFLAEYAKRGNVAAGCQKAGISRTTVYRWLEHDEDFSLRHEQAKADYCDRLRNEIDRRAHDGVLKPVYQSGFKVGSIREYSDTLLIFQAKAKMPEYREKVQVEQSGQVSVQHDVSQNAAAALYATLFVAALDSSGASDASGPRISSE
jgi:hypothetical protein